MLKSSSDSKLTQTKLIDAEPFAKTDEHLLDRMCKKLDAVGHTSYIGPFGYTLWKSEMQKVDGLESVVKRVLTIYPTTTDDKYYAYRETQVKLFVPKQFGLARFGYKSAHAKREFASPKLTRLAIDSNPLVFGGTLRPEQLPAVDAYFKALDANKEKYSVNAGGGGLFELPCGFGKTDTGLFVMSKIRERLLDEFNCQQPAPSPDAVPKLATLVVVHKEFLADQWIDRIRQYFPNARIGRIQESTVDVEDKDIIIGMIQSLSSKKYHPSTFDSIGMLLVDEVHRSSSKMFSNVFFKVAPKYTLGLSATMERKDGTSHMFKHFLGDIVYSAKRAATHAVTVRVIRYETNDDDFNEILVDKRDKVAYSAMINKLCDYMPRTEVILSAIENELASDPSDQIIVLAQNKSILKTLREHIDLRTIGGPDAAGFYIGGMKKHELTTSSEKRIILATYAMAAEALDIKTLRKLIMATPKSDIIQSVGRILREKDTQPTVVDVVDPHFVFMNQSKKRKHFFKDENYTIVQCKSGHYMECSKRAKANTNGLSANQLVDWYTVFKPRTIDNDIDTTIRSVKNSSRRELDVECLHEKNTRAGGCAFFKRKLGS